MLYTLEDKVTVFSLILLLVICIVTVEICRRDKLTGVITKGSFWFTGKSKVFSLASNLGALASVTYFFGGGLTYGFTFGPWYLAAASVVFILVGVLVLKMLGSLQEHGVLEDQISNPLITFMRKRLRPGEIAIVLRLYAFIYSALLVVELAAGRLAISALLPVDAAIVTIFMITISLVIFSYLYLGGFKAVLNSDLAQLAILVPFIGCLSFLLLREEQVFPGRQAASFSPLDFPSFVFLVLTGVAYFVAGFDFFSRFNFSKDPNGRFKNPTQSFAVISLGLIFLMLLVAILYGMYLKTYRAEVGSAREFSRFVTAHFTERGGLAVPLLFVVCIICMMFTTIDTLLLTLFQLGLEAKNPFLVRSNIAPVLSSALVISSFVDLDLVSVIAAFALSLFVLPLLAVWKAFAQKPIWCMPSTLRFLEWALLFSIILFSLFYRQFTLVYDSHFLIMGIVVSSTLAAAMLAGIGDLLRRR